MELQRRSLKASSLWEWRLSDWLHPLQRDRAILVEAVSQQSQLARLHRENQLNPTPFIDEGERLAERLIEVQEQIEELDLD